MAPTTRNSARTKTEKTPEQQENKVPADRKLGNNKTENMENLNFPQRLINKLKPTTKNTITKPKEEPLPKLNRGVFMRTDWKDWTRHDVIQFVREHITSSQIVKNVWEEKVDGKLLEKIIQFNMESDRLLRFGGENPLENPAEGLTPEAHFKISRLYWIWATASLRKFNRSR